MRKFLPNPPKDSGHNLLYLQFRDMLDSHDPQVALTDTIKWDTFNDYFKNTRVMRITRKAYTLNGRTTDFKTA